MDMKTVKRLIGTVCFLLILVLLIGSLTYITRNKYGAEMVHPYYDEAENSLDVVFVGSSHVMCSVYPMELYHEYGITSYNCTSTGLLQPQVHYLTVEALRTQAPKVLVLDVSGVMYENAKIGSPEYAHTLLDNMKWSLNKIAAINDLIETPSDRLEYYFPLLKFHTRWKELLPQDFEPINGVSKGAYISDSVLADPPPIQLVAEDYTEPLSAYAEAYLRKTLDYCRDQDIPVLLFNPPTLLDGTVQGKHNAVYAIAEEYGLPYLNLMYHLDDIGFDCTTDFRDTGHCNRAGAEKVTAYLGNYLKEHYTLPDRRSDPAYASAWDTAYARYAATYF